MFVTPKLSASAALCFPLLLSLMLRSLVIAEKQQVTVDDINERGKGKLISYRECLLSSAPCGHLVTMLQT